MLRQEANAHEMLLAKFEKMQKMVDDRCCLPLALNRTSPGVTFVPSINAIIENSKNNGLAEQSCWGFRLFEIMFRHFILANTIL